MYSTLPLIVISARFSQFANAAEPINQTLSGIVTLVRPELSQNAWLSILSTPSSMVRLCKRMQRENTSVPMLVILPGTVTLPSIAAGAWMNCVMSLLYKIPSRAA